MLNGLDLAEGHVVKNNHSVWKSRMLWLKRFPYRIEHCGRDCKRQWGLSSEPKRERVYAASAACNGKMKPPVSRLLQIPCASTFEPDNDHCFWWQSDHIDRLTSLSQLILTP